MDELRINRRYRSGSVAEVALWTGLRGRYTTPNSRGKTRGSRGTEKERCGNSTT